MAYLILDDRSRTSTSAVETIVPIVKDVEEEEEASKPISSSSRSLVFYYHHKHTYNAIKLKASTVSSRLERLLLQSEAVKETATIQRYEKIKLNKRINPGETTRKNAKGKNAVVRTDCQVSGSVTIRLPPTQGLTTYNDQFVNDVVTTPSTRDEIGENTHHDHGRNPYQPTTGKEEGGEPSAGTSLSVDHGVWLSATALFGSWVGECEGVSGVEVYWKWQFKLLGGSGVPKLAIWHFISLAPILLAMAPFPVFNQIRALVGDA